MILCVCACSADRHQQPNKLQDHQANQMEGAESKVSSIKSAAGEKKVISQKQDKMKVFTFIIFVFVLCGTLAAPSPVQPEDQDPEWARGPAGTNHLINTQLFYQSQCFSCKYWIPVCLVWSHLVAWSQMLCCSSDNLFRLQLGLVPDWQVVSLCHLF